MTLKSLKIGKHIIPIPIVQGGMGVGISWDTLAGTVSNEGGLGVISAVGTGYYQYPRFAGSRTIPDSMNFDSDEALTEIVKNARKICGDKPLAVNIMLAQTSYDRTVLAACKAGIDIIISGAGMAFKLAELTKDYPDIALVPIIRDVKVLNVFIKKWVKIGRKVDAVVLEGPKSGGHQGFDFEQCLLPENQLEATFLPVFDLANEHNIPVIVAGGIWDKSDIEKFISMGASGVQMGTRFAATIESNASDAHKNALLNANEEDISLKKSPVGLPSRSITSNLHKLIAEGNAPKIKCISNCVGPCQQGVGAKEAGYCIADRLADCQQGKEETGLFFTGTNGSRVKEIIPVHVLMKKLTEGEDSV